jgi:hypothetical protein
MKDVFLFLTKEVVGWTMKDKGSKGHLSQVLVPHGLPVIAIDDGSVRP